MTSESKSLRSIFFGQVSIYDTNMFYSHTLSCTRYPYMYVYVHYYALVHKAHVYVLLLYYIYPYIYVCMRI